MHNTTDRIISIANRQTKDKYNILTFPTHERYETELCKTGHEFYALNINGMKQWNSKQTDIPINYHVLPENQLCNYLDYDILLVQSKFGQFQLAQNINQQLGIPIVCLEHTIPTMATMNYSQIEQMKNMVGDFNVFISDFSKKAWGINGTVIHHGIDTNTFTTKNDISKTDSVLTVANDFIQRDYCLNFSGWKRVTSNFHTKLIGDTKGLSEPAKNLTELVDAYNSCGVYLNTSTFSPIPMSLLEAMSCGCAIVSTATCMIPEIIVNGHNGYISNDEDELKNYIKTILDDQELRDELGKNARQTIIENFSEHNFIKNWNLLFSKVYEESTK